MNYFVGNLKTRIHLHFPYDFALLPSLREKLKIINLLKIQIMIINYNVRAGSVYWLLLIVSPQYHHMITAFISVWGYWDCIVRGYL